MHHILMSDVEKFSEKELRGLREDLRQSGLDCFQAGTLLQAFLIAKGYGVSTTDARHAAALLEFPGTTLPRMQEELERVAFVM